MTDSEKLRMIADHLEIISETDFENELLQDLRRIADELEASRSDVPNIKGSEWWLERMRSKLTGFQEDGIQAMAKEAGEMLEQYARVRSDVPIEKKQIDLFEYTIRLLGDDGFCATFQTIGQYRNALIKNLHDEYKRVGLL